MLACHWGAAGFGPLPAERSPPPASPVTFCGHPAQDRVGRRRFFARRQRAATGAPQTPTAEAETQTDDDA
eukprot:6328657-Lingulodinium_polyedra.AAC.1